MQALTIRDLNFYYGSRLILNDVTFSVPFGSICGLLGPNGSGKTTLFRCINGFLKPTTGTVEINNTSLAQMSRQEIAQNISIVPQQTNNVFGFKVVDMVVMGRSPTLEIWQKPTPFDRINAVDLLKELGVEHLTERPFNEISGGERQMVLLARAIFQNTPIMLLDEPTSHLDLKNQVKIMELVRSVALEKGITVIMTLHDPNLALNYCDEIVLLKNGRIVDMGEKGRVLIDKSLSAVYELKIRVRTTHQGKQVILPESW